MQLKNYYWYFDNVLSKNFCNNLIKYGNSLREKQALTLGMKDEDVKDNKRLDNLKKVRDSNVVWLEGKWLYDELFHFVQIANYNAGWNYQWDWAEQCQFTKYKLNQFYNWHIDSHSDPYTQQGPLQGKIRKLSMIVQLSDPKDYVGGDIEFDFRKNTPEEKQKIVQATEVIPQGSIMVFPGFVWHRVKPVTQGTRYSLVMWCCGRPWQ